ncbi:uncharacterized protein BJX67DRAFT_150648 [Aspergillus lucknowensis]|uniref:Uncharacterized protein n=1 Tax=Aspergillus lucknowensis TaxID=176173 RepID=A0ABR4LRH3_9EURO
MIMTLSPVSEPAIQENWSPSLRTWIIRRCAFHPQYSSLSGKPSHLFWSRHHETSYFLPPNIVLAFSELTVPSQPPLHPTTLVDDDWTRRRILRVPHKSTWRSCAMTQVTREGQGSQTNHRMIDSQGITRTECNTLLPGALRSEHSVCKSALTRTAT